MSASEREAALAKSAEKIVDGFNNYLRNALLERGALRDCLAAIRAEVIPFGHVAAVCARAEKLLQLTEQFDGERSHAQWLALLAMTTDEGVTSNPTPVRQRTINANDIVKVKLTKYGEHLLRLNDANLRVPHIPLLRDEDGYVEFHLWQLMQSFGPHIHMGQTQHPFDMTMVLV